MARSICVESSPSAIPYAVCSIFRRNSRVRSSRGWAKNSWEGACSPTTPFSMNTVLEETLRANLFVAINNIFKLSSIPFAWFSTFVAINAVVFGTLEGFVGSSALGIQPDIRWAAIWYLWAIIWGTSFVEDIMGKKLGKFVPALQVFEGIVTAWIPGVLMLIGKW